MLARLNATRLLLFAIALAVGIGVLVAKQLHQSRDTVWQRAYEANRNVLFTVSQVLQRQLNSTDVALRYTANQLNGRSAAEMATIPNGLLFRAVPLTGTGIQLVLDDEGRLIRSSETVHTEEWSFPDRDYFIAHKTGEHTGLFISRPFHSRQDGQLSIALSRRWNQEDGSFGGIVVQTLKLSDMRDLFSAIELGRDSGINLISFDGTIVMRFPYTGHSTGRSLAGTPNFERFMTEREGSFIGIAALDGMERLYTFTRLDGYPLLINTAQSTDSILHSWRENARWLGGATFVLMLGCIALALLAEKELRAHRRTARRLRRSERETRIILDSLPVVVGHWDKYLNNRFCNAMHEEWFGISPEAARGKHIRAVIGESSYQAVAPRLALVLQGHTQVFERTFIDYKGKRRHVVSTYIPDVGESGIDGFYVLVGDITDRKLAEDQLSEEKERFRVTLEAIKDGVITTDKDGNITYQNPAASAMTGCSGDAAIGRPVEEVVDIHLLALPNKPVPNPVRTALAQRIPVRSNAEHVLVRESGHRVHIEESAAPIFDEGGELVGAVLVFHDVGDARALAQKMMHLAQHDALTGLPNRRFLEQLANQSIARANRQDGRVGILYLDLDGFKEINDAHGHDMGDQLLIAVSERLSEVLRHGDTLSRKGGDEFVILMDGIADASDAEQLAKRLIHNCAQPYFIDGQALEVTVSVGIAIYPDDADNFEGLVRRADAAMYDAKTAGRNQYAKYDATSDLTS